MEQAGGQDEPTECDVGLHVHRGAIGLLAAAAQRVHQCGLGPVASSYTNGDTDLPTNRDMDPGTTAADGDVDPGASTANGDVDAGTATAIGNMDRGTRTANGDLHYPATTYGDTAQHTAYSHPGHLS